MMPAANQGTGQNVGYPDTCDTPTSSANVPIPYPNLGQDTLSSSFSATVFVSLLPAHNQSAAPSMTNGDNAGVAQSTGNMGKGGCVTGNAIVHISGQPAEHMCTPSQGNNWNNSSGSKLIPSLTNVFISSAGLGPAATLSWRDTQSLLDELSDAPDEDEPGITWGPGGEVLHVRRDGLGRALGLRRGDRILAWNGTSEPASVRPGQRVRAGFTRGGVRLEREATRPRPQPAVRSRLEGELGRIAILRFTAGAPERVREAAWQLQQRGATRLVLDLRGCPGGLLASAAELARWCLDALRCPLELQVDANSASAAEVLVAALRGRAPVTGGPTWGKRHVEWLTGVPGQPHARVRIPLAGAHARPYGSGCATSGGASRHTPSSSSSSQGRKRAL